MMNESATDNQCRYLLERCLSFIGDDLRWYSDYWEQAERFLADIMPEVRKLDRALEADGKESLSKGKAYSSSLKTL